MSGFEKTQAAIDEKIANFTANIFQKKATERTPSRINLYLIGGAAFLMFTVLDLIAAVVVGIMTNALYGLLVFGIGVGALAVSALAHFFPYASKYQKIVALADGVTAIGSTLVIGVLAAVVYAVDKFGIFTFGDKIWILDVSLIVLLVGIGVVHGILWIAYVLIDHGIAMYQNAQATKASIKIKNDELNYSMILAEQMIERGARIKGAIDANKGQVLRAAIREVTGDDMDFDAMMVEDSRKNGAGHSQKYPTQGGSVS